MGTAHQAFLSFTISWSLLKGKSVESMMPSKHLIFCHHLLFLPSIFTSIKVLSDKLALRIRWPKYGRFPLELTDVIQDGSPAWSEVVATITVEVVAGRWGAGSTKPKIGPGPKSEGLHPERRPVLAHGAL